MTLKKFLLLAVLSVTLFQCGQNELQMVEPQIIPKPLEQTLSEGQFVLDSKVGIQFDEAFQVSATYLKMFIERDSLIVLKSEIGKRNIMFQKNDSLSKEAYQLDISKEAITISAATDAGAFYAAQSLRQLLPAAFENGTFQETAVGIKALSIKDSPRFSYRGMHLDVCRHMFPLEFLKDYIDAMAMLKMNTFHWHLTEDQGWRIEIKKYPKLQEVAAFRNGTIVGHFPGTENDNQPHGGFYTQEQVKELVAYAAKRHITIIPEIELPGHSSAAIAAYPNLSCFPEKPTEVPSNMMSEKSKQLQQSGTPKVVQESWGVFDDIYCAGKEETFAFLEGVLDEVVPLFPSEYIHIGGDEAPKTHWKTCPNCQKRIQDEGLKDEHGLQSYFVTRMEKYLNSKGKQIIGWDEILEGGLAPNATVMSWRGTKGAVEAAKQQHNVIMTPTSHCYFDYYQSTNPDEPLAIGGFLPLEKVYGFNPIPEELTGEEAKFILGAQGNLWTEYIPTEDQVEYMVFPRMVAMAEVDWSMPNNKDYTDFVGRLEQFNTRLDALDVNYANHLYDIKGQLINEKNQVSYKLDKVSKNHTIYYSLDGKEPSPTSHSAYTKPIGLDTSVTIKAATFDEKGNKLSATFSETFSRHKAVGKSITISPQANPAYSGSGAQGLINGILGSDTRYGDKEWLGFWGDDVEITIDFEEPTKIKSIETRFYDANGQWIYAPEHIAIRIIFDNDEVIANKFLPESSENPNLKRIFWEQSILSNRPIKSVKLLVPNYGTIPDGKQSAGNKAWTFIDEIIVN